MTRSGKSFAAHFCDLMQLSCKFAMAVIFMASASQVVGQTVETLCSLNCLNGAYPSALTLGNDGNFYGSTDNGGFGYIYDATMFKVTTNGTLTSFNNSSGGDPAGLTLGTDGNFYGTTRYGGQGDLGGDDGDGTVFMMTTNGTITTLYSFTDGLDGAWPNGLTLGDDGNFYGTTDYGGNNTYYGTIFKVTTSGTLTTLFSFSGSDGWQAGRLTLGNDGCFYGTTYSGVSNTDDGTIFRVSTNGTLTTLVNFNSTNGSGPYGALALGNDGNFYGTTTFGGNSDNGTLFRVTTSGTLTTLYNFNGQPGSNGEPMAAMTLGSDGNFYGTTTFGGSRNGGTVFCLLLPPVIRPTLTLQFSAGCPQLNLCGTLGNDFVVEYCTNLANPHWTNLLCLTNLSSSPYPLSDPAGVGQPARFYRAVMQ